MILSRADQRRADTFSADEVDSWPDGALERFLVLGIVREIEPSREVLCIECERGCWIEPDIRTDKRTGKKVGRFFCKDNEDVGAFDVDLERRRSWAVNIPGLAAGAAKALSAQGSVQEIEAGRFYTLGRVTLGEQQRDVLLLRGSRWSDAGRVFTKKGTSPSLRPVMLVPGAPPEGARRKHLRGLMVGLREILSVGPNGLKIDRDRLADLCLGQRRTKGRAAQTEAKKALLISTLLTYHGVGTKHPTYSHCATEEELGNLMKCHQTTVCRIAKKIRPDFMGQYKAACARERLKGFLEDLDDGTQRHELPDRRLPARRK
ncbi:MAG: hypothetical protein JXL80_18315 [Planctomycetes bacterium]|nr:hypothetical protein [Planctomycetota bacterium]